MDMKRPVNEKWLKTKEEIMSYCRISEPIFFKWLRIGLPAIVLDGSYRAHTDNLDNFCRLISRTGAKEPDESAE